jgi:negative regulator of flagellin synthesis FlgM
MNRIDLNQLNQAETARVTRSNEANRTNQAEKTQSPTSNTESESDRITVSGRAETVERLAARANELPDVRQDKVEAMRERIQSGTYKPSASDIAGAILKDER